jgi:hypothetical protein
MSANLNDLLNQFQSDVNLVNEFVKGDATVTVVGSAGSYPSLAKIAADVSINVSVLANNIQAALSQLVVTCQTDANAILVAGQNQVNDLITANQAALVVSQTAINNVLALAVGTISKIYKFNDMTSLPWVVTHDMGTMDFTIAIVNSNGTVVHEESIEVVSNNEFVIHFTDYEIGKVFVTFYFS